MVTNIVDIRTLLRTPSEGDVRNNTSNVCLAEESNLTRNSAFSIDRAVRLHYPNLKLPAMTDRMLGI